MFVFSWAYNCRIICREINNPIYNKQLPCILLVLRAIQLSLFCICPNCDEWEREFNHYLYLCIYIDEDIYLHAYTYICNTHTHIHSSVRFGIREKEIRMYRQSSTAFLAAIQMRALFARRQGILYFYSLKKKV